MGRGMRARVWRPAQAGSLRSQGGSLRSQGGSVFGLARRGDG
jgi:hypothetical protein